MSITLAEKEKTKELLSEQRHNRLVANYVKFTLKPTFSVFSEKLKSLIQVDSDDSSIYFVNGFVDIEGHFKRYVFTQNYKAIFDFEPRVFITLLLFELFDAKCEKHSTVEDVLFVLVSNIKVRFLFDQRNPESVCIAIDFLYTRNVSRYFRNTTFPVVRSFYGCSFEVVTNSDIEPEVPEPL